MNRFVNALLLFLLFPTMTLAIFVGFDLPIQFMRVLGSEFPHKEYVFLGFGLAIFIVNLRRSIRKWMGMSMVLKIARFKWNEQVSAQRRKRVGTYSILESVVMFFVAYSLYTITPLAWAPATAFAFAGIENIVFYYTGVSRKGFRVALSSKALIAADREVIVMYFTGLRKVSIHQQTIYFDYIKNLQLSFPLDCIQEESRTEFFEQLKSQLDPEKVYFSKTN